MRRITIIALAGVWAMGLLAAPAPAADNSFDGDCEDIEDTARFDVPLTGTAGDNGYHFTGSGVCTGKLNGADVTDAPINAQVDGHFNGSCTGSESTDEGPGRLVFTMGTPVTTDDVVIAFTMTFTGTGPQVEFVLKGTKSGQASGTASFLTTRTPPDIVLKCETDGNSELPFDATAEGETPLVSESGPPSPPAPGPGGGTPPPPPGGGEPSGQPSQGGGPSSGQARQDGLVALEVAGQRLRDVLRRGLRATCRATGPARCTVRLLVSTRIARRHRLPAVLGRGSATVADGADRADVSVRLSGRARRRLKKVRSLAVTVEAVIAGRKVTRVVKLR